MAAVPLEIRNEPMKKKTQEQSEMMTHTCRRSRRQFIQLHSARQRHILLQVGKLHLNELLWIQRTVEVLARGKRSRKRHTSSVYSLRSETSQFKSKNKKK